MRICSIVSKSEAGKAQAHIKMNMTQVLRFCYHFFVHSLYHLLWQSFSCSIVNTVPSVCYRVIEMPYAYQCCVYGSCDSYKPASQWDTEQSNTDEDLHKRTVAMYPIHADTHCKKASVRAYSVYKTHSTHPG